MGQTCPGEPEQRIQVMVRQEAKNNLFIGIDEQYFAFLLYKRLKHTTFTNSAKSYGLGALK